MCAGVSIYPPDIHTCGLLFCFFHSVSVRWSKLAELLKFLIVFSAHLKSSVSQKRLRFWL